MIMCLIIESKEDEILPALTQILRAANKYHIDADYILLKFQHKISSFTALKGRSATSGGGSVHTLFDRTRLLSYQQTKI